MATLDLGNPQERLVVLTQSRMQLRQLFMVQCYSIGIDPLSVDIATYDFVSMHPNDSYVAEQLQKMAASLVLNAQQIADAENDIAS